MSQFKTLKKDLHGAPHNLKKILAHLSLTADPNASELDKGEEDVIGEAVVQYSDLDFESFDAEQF